MSCKTIRPQSIWLTLSAMGMALVLSVWPSRATSSEALGGTWMFANRVAVQVFECRGQLCGKIV
jgi:hypothetical protein